MKKIINKSILFFVVFVIYAFNYSTIISNVNASVYVSTDKLCIEKGWIYKLKFDELLKRQISSDRYYKTNIFDNKPSRVKELAEYNSPCSPSTRYFLYNKQTAPSKPPKHLSPSLKEYAYCFTEPDLRGKKRNYDLLTKNCKAWNLNIANDVFKHLKQIERTKQKNEKIRKKAIANKIKKEKEDLEKLAQRKKKLKEDVSNILNLDISLEAKNILWPTSINTENTKIKQFKLETLVSLDDMFNSLNSTIEHANNYGFFEPLVFHENKKGEFEKTIDYEQRIKNEKESFNARVSEEKEKYKNELSELYSIILNKYFGKPTISSVNYEADSELFLVTIKSNDAPYKIIGEYQHPIATAKEQKIKMSKGEPKISFLLSNGVFEPKIALLVVDDEIITLTNIKFPKSTITFGSNAANAWKSKIEKKKIFKENQLKKEQAEYIFQQNKARDARRKKYNHTGSFLVPDSLVCTKLKSIHKALILSRTHAYATIPTDCIHLGSDYTAIKNSENLSMGGISNVLFLNGTRALVSTDSIID